MKKILSLKDWELACKDYVFIGCALRGDEGGYCIAYLQLKQDLPQEEVAFMADEDIESRVLCIYNEEEKKSLSFGLTTITHFESPVAGVSLKPVAQGLTISNNINGTVLPIGGGRADWEYESLNPGMFPECARLRCIDGYTWSAGGHREVYKRTDIGIWQNLSIPKETQKAGVAEEFTGFSDIDGFGSNDVFAVGGRGDVWHNDGSRWTPCKFPSDERLYVICCTHNHNVYIGGQKGIWKKTGEHWQRVCELNMEYPLNSACWYQNKLWISHDCGLLVWDGRELTEQIVYKNLILPLRGHLDACGKWLMISSLHSVWTYDGSDWYNIIPDYSV